MTTKEQFSLFKLLFIDAKRSEVAYQKAMRGAIVDRLNALKAMKQVVGEDGKVNEMVRDALIFQSRLTKIRHRMREIAQLVRDAEPLIGTSDGQLKMDTAAKASLTWRTSRQDFRTTVKDATKKWLLFEKQVFVSLMQ